MRSEPAVFLPLSQGKVAVIDFSDFELVRGFKYYAYTPGRITYAARSKASPVKAVRQTTVSLHRDILGLKTGDPRQVDHKDHNGCNNTRSNLRLCSNRENSRHRRSRLGSTSKYLGVSLPTNRFKWRAVARWPGDSALGDGKKAYLGSFDSEVDAALAYDVFAREHYGEFANCNFPAPTLP